MKEEVLLMKNYKGKKSQKKFSITMEQCMRQICKYYNVKNTDIEAIIEKFYKNNKYKA